MPLKIVSDCSKTLAGAGWTIAFVESATAGRMCSEFSLTANIADRQVFEGNAEEIILKAIDHAARLIINHLSS